MENRMIIPSSVKEVTVDGKQNDYTCISRGDYRDGK